MIMEHQPMDFSVFKTLVAKWVAENVVPAVAPEGVGRWMAGFAAVALVQSAADRAGVIPRTADGCVDMDALAASLDAAFAAQPKLTVTVPQIPQLAAFGVGETSLTFTKADADALLSHLHGITETEEVQL